MVRGTKVRAATVAALSALLAVPMSVGANVAHAAPGCKKQQQCSMDTTMPSITIASPASGSTVVETVTVSGTSSDNASVVKVEVAVGSGPFQMAAGTNNWSTGIDTKAYANGTHTIVARATDTSGNAASKSTIVTVSNATPGSDSVAPAVVVTGPSAGSTVAGTVTVSGSASDNAAVARVDRAVDGGAWSPASGTTSWSWSWDTGSLANGAHTVAARAVDTSGNVSSTVTVTVTVANPTSPPPPPPSVCSDGSSVLQQAVTPEGVRIVICTSVGGWTTKSIYDLLLPNALDLSVIGPHLTVQVQTGTPSSTGSSVSCCDTGGRHYGYGAVIVLNPSATSSFSAAPDAIMAHEYGHAWTYYWLYMNPANDGSWAAYHNFRWVAAGGTQVLAQSPSLNTGYSWMDYEMAADDYRRLFGSPVAQSQLTYLNSRVPDSRQVTGLADFFLNTWR